MDVAAEAQGPRVLVIDDDHALLRMVRLCMMSAGLTVTTADSGVTGLDSLENRDIEVIVLDLQMPGMDGRSFHREMTSRGHDASVVILSAYGAEEARRELGAAAALAKPFDPDVLIETVLEVAGQRAQEFEQAGLEGQARLPQSP
jgi:two-component system chemotaxis response regulator CheY